MKENDLDKTKPIKVLSDIDEKKTRSKNGVVEETRSEKYEDVLIDDMAKEQEELAEEALAEKNIALAEAYLAEEKNNNEILNEEDTSKKQNIMTKIKDWWSELDKKKKIMLIIVSILLVAIIVLLIIYGIFGGKKPQEPVKEPEVIEEAPVVADNFYYKSGSLYFLDDQESEIGNYECTNKDSNLCYVAYNNYRDNFDVAKLEDEKGIEIINRMPVYENNYVFIFDNEEENSKLVKMYSLKDNKVVQEYNDVKAYDDNYVIVADKDNKYGLLKIENGVTEVIDLQYKYLGMIDGEDYLIAQDSKGYMVINKSDKKVSSTFSNSYIIKSYNKNYVVAEVNDEYNLYDYKATMIDGGYSYISVNGRYAALVDGSKVYVIDNDKAKYNEGDVSLKNRDYVKTYVYDEEGNLVKTNRSFEWNVKDSSIEFAIYEEDVLDPTYNTISIVEGLINKNHKYVNYFNSKLYFYKDEEKTDLIGSYSCNNQNYVTKDSDTYTSCFIAKDTIYEDNDMMGSTDKDRKAMTPLINDTFVFISDGVNEVKLYNLVGNKVMGTYSSVNTYTENNNYTFDKYNGKVEVVGMNKKGKYGVLEIDGSNVKALYTFDYNKVERLGNYYLMQDTSNSWQMKDNDWESIILPGKILGYSSDTKYYKVKVNNAYAVYNSDGQALGSGYQYVELYSSYYAGVDSNKELYIYDYNGTQLTSDVVKIGNYSYTRTETPAFKVKKDGDNYVVSVYNGSEYEDKVLSVTTAQS